MSLLNEVRVNSAIIVKKKNCDDKAFTKKQSINTYATTRIVKWFWLTDTADKNVKCDTSKLIKMAPTHTNNSAEMLKISDNRQQTHWSLLTHTKLVCLKPLNSSHHPTKPQLHPGNGPRWLSEYLFLLTVNTKANLLLCDWLQMDCCNIWITHKNTCTQRPGTSTQSEALFSHWLTLTHPCTTYLYLWTTCGRVRWLRNTHAYTQMRVHQFLPMQKSTIHK